MQTMADRSLVGLHRRQLRRRISRDGGDQENPRFVLTGRLRRRCDDRALAQAIRDVTIVRTAVITGRVMLVTTGTVVVIVLTIHRDFTRWTRTLTRPAVQHGANQHQDTRQNGRKATSDHRKPSLLNEIQQMYRRTLGQVRQGSLLRTPGAARGISCRLVGLDLEP